MAHSSSFARRFFKNVGGDRGHSDIAPHRRCGNCRAHKSIQKDRGFMVARPMLWPDLASPHPLGTDMLGRDILTGILYGARVSLIIGTVATASALLIGTIIGGIRWVSRWSSRQRSHADYGKYSKPSRPSFSP